MTGVISAIVIVACLGSAFVIGLLHTRIARIHVWAGLIGAAGIATALALDNAILMMASVTIASVFTLSIGISVNHRRKSVIIPSTEADSASVASNHNHASTLMN